CWTDSWCSSGFRWCPATPSTGDPWVRSLLHRRRYATSVRFYTEEGTLPEQPRTYGRPYVVSKPATSLKPVNAHSVFCMQTIAGSPIRTYPNGGCGKAGNPLRLLVMVPFTS